MNNPVKHLYEFGEFRVNPNERLLQRSGKNVPLPPKVFDLLLALVVRHGQVVTKDQLMSEVWPDTFVEETNLKVYVSTLRKALSTGGDGDEGARLIETLPRRGYRFTAPITEILPDEPAFPELIIEKQTISRIVIEEKIEAPQQLELPAELPPRSATELRTGQLAARSASGVRTRIPHPRVWAVGGGLLLLFLLGWFAREQWAVRTGQVRSLAVLPFTALTPMPDGEQLGIGLADALITRLSNTGGLIVRPTSAILKFTAADRDSIALARRLEVDAILDGRLQRDGEQLRLTVQLLRAGDGKALWAESFEAAAGNSFALQRAVSERLAHALTLKLSDEQQRKFKQDYTANPAAFEAYSRGRYFYGKQNKDSYQKAINYFKQAIELDPNYALAWAGLADCYNAQSTTVMSMGSTPFQSFTAEARTAAERAIALDENLPEAHLSLVAAVVDREHDLTHRALDRALELNPNLAQAYNVYTLELIGDARLEDALLKAERACELDPLSLSANTNRGLVLYRLHRYPEAVAQFQKTLELDANFSRAYFGYGMTLEQLGRYDDAIAAYQKCFQLSGGGSVPLSSLGHVYAVSGRRAEAEQVLARMLELHEQKLAVPYYVSLVYAGLGDKDNAIAWLEKQKPHVRFLAMAKTDARFDSLRSDPRYLALISN